jgi:hypothetical protein
MSYLDRVVLAGRLSVNSLDCTIRDPLSNTQTHAHVGTILSFEDVNEIGTMANGTRDEAYARVQEADSYVHAGAGEENVWGHNAGTDRKVV